MKSSQESYTAEGAAFARAVHLLYDDPVIFKDPFAIKLLDRKVARLCRSRIAPWLLRGPIQHAFGPFLVSSLCCARYAEEQLDKAVASGVDQYVVIGAGLDSFALRRRDLEQVLRVYELDHPASQQAKRERLAALGGKLPGNLALVPIDFEQASLSEALSAADFEPDRPALFSWLGTVVYLTESAVFSTLKSVARFAAPGSELIFNYTGPAAGVALGDRVASALLKRATMRAGEPLVSEFDSAVLPEKVCRLGYELVANLSAKELTARYVSGRSDGLRPEPTIYLAHFRTTGKRAGRASAKKRVVSKKLSRTKKR